MIPGLPYERPCGCDEHNFSLPTIDELIEGEMSCPKCGGTFSVDDDDRNILLAYLIARVERLEVLLGLSPAGNGLPVI